MIRSMTGFGHAEAGTSVLRATVRIRSLNHRYLDVVCHLSPCLAPFEPEIKALVQSRLERGKVEVQARASFPGEGTATVLPSRPLVEGLVRSLRELGAAYGLQGEVSVGDVARFPGALEVLDTPATGSEEGRGEFLDLVGRALDGVEAMRRAEGENLARDLGGSLETIEAATVRIEGLSEESKSTRRQALLEDVRELVADLGLEATRLYAEIVRLVDRSDVREETQRLRSHIALARELLRGEEASGKRLDFLTQELMREANTIGSKAASAPLVQEVVALKSEIERLREQVQNVE